MFRVSFFVDDKRLGHALRALAGMIHGSPEVLPVVNANVGKDGKITAQTDGNSGELFMQYVAKRKLKEVNAQVAKEFQKSIGRSTQSATYVLQQAQKLGRLKKTPGTKGSRMTYQVQKARS